MRTREFKFKCRECNYEYKDHTPESDTSLESECPECGEENYKARGRILTRTEAKELGPAYDS